MVDLGCGPGQIGRYLETFRLHVVGIDLSLQMLRRAAATAGSPAVAQADMRALPVRDASVGAVVAFYSLIHIPPDQLASAVAEIGRVLAPGGRTGIAVHATEPAERASTAHPIPGGGLRVDEMLSEPVGLDFYFYGLDRLTELLRAAGFEISWAQERNPYPGGVEVATRRAYVLARKTAPRR